MRPMPALARSALLLAALGLAGCTGTRDPNEAGFFDGVRNLATGAYEEDTSQMRATAASAELRAQQLREDNARLQLELARLSEEDRALRQRQQRLNSQLAAQIQALQRIRTAKAATQVQLTSLEQRVAAAEAEQRRLSQRAASEVDPDEVARLERENTALRQDIDRILAAMPQ
jgi:DNA repair exonuclease SbcCD ATPase subunit